MLRNLALSLALAATACAGGSKTAAPTSTTPAAAESAMLELGELKLVEANKDQALTIQADGTITLPDGDADGPLKVTSDGKLMKADQTVVLQLLPDGTIQGPDGKPIEVTLSADGVITSKDQKISLDDNGTVLGTNSGASQMRFEGATTPGLKRTALFVLVALLGRAEPAPPPPATERVAN